MILADVLAIAAFLGGLGIAVRRLMLLGVRILTDFKDVLLLVLTLTLLGSGIVASHNPANYSFWITLHVLCGVIVLRRPRLPSWRTSRSFLHAHPAGYGLRDQARWNEEQF